MGVRSRSRRRGAAALALVAGSFLLALPSPGRAASAVPASTHPADADDSVDAGNPTVNEGSAPELPINAIPARQGYLRFTVPESSIAAATLRLFATTGSEHDVIVYQILDNGWTEDGITWSTKPPLGPPLITIHQIPEAGWVNFDVSAAVVGPGTYSFAVGTPFDTEVRFVSREGSTDQRPELVISDGLPDAAPPSDPAGLAVTAPSPFRTALSWNPSSDDVTVGGYQVYRAAAQSPWIWIGTASTASFVDPTVRPGATYRYSVAAFDRAGHSSNPATPAAATVPLSADPMVAAAGDIACDPEDPDFNDGLGANSNCRMRDTAKLLRDPSLDAVLPLGDDQYEDGALAAFGASYDPTWGRRKPITHPSAGNHEYRTPGAAGYFEYFGEAAGDPAKGYYSYELGSWHVVVVNSNCTPIGGCEVGSPQERWLRHDLATHPAACTLAYWHHPLFASGASFGDNPQVKPIWQALYQYGVEVVLNGHEHTYERFGPQSPNGVPDPANGIREFVVGTGGKSLTGFHEIVRNSEVRSVDSFGVLELLLRPDGYDWRFLSAAGGWFTDFGSGACH